ncbi:unnamed protein product [Strongylus vulgaris]|uniref:Uncharacterized protein n=1 Tax=Strongylus vulgaris TaxID=40348 RepID=A0A3P7IX97_STRVU|nr:unnamed protein product [Strongylus vulgaris]
MKTTLGQTRDLQILEQAIKDLWKEEPADG